MDIWWSFGMINGAIMIFHCYLVWKVKCLCLKLIEQLANYVDVVGNWRLRDIKNWLPHHVTEVISTLMPPCPSSGDD